MAWFSLATTYIIKENGVEVGRWNEEDGKDVEEIVEQTAIERVPQPERKQYEPLPPSRYEWYEGARGHDALLQVQKKSNRPAALYFYATWCPHCKNFEKDVLYTGPVGDYLSGFAHVRINVDKEKVLVKKYGVRSFPTFLVRFPGGEVNTVSRTGTPKTFIESLKKAGLKK